jgi:hypothetical protein
MLAGASVDASKSAQLTSHGPSAGKLFHLRLGNLSVGRLLSLYYFLIISGYAAGLAARDTLFLDLN